MKKHFLDSLLALLFLPAVLSAAEFSFDFRPASDKAVRAEAGKDGGQIANAPEIVASHLVRTDSARAASRADFAVGDRISVRLFSEDPLEIRLMEKSANSSGGTSFLGATGKSGDIVDSVVVQDNHGIQMTIQDMGSGRVYTVFSLDGETRVTEWKTGGGPRECRTLEPPVPDGWNADAAQKTAGEAEVSPKPGQTYVDVLVAFDTTAVSWLSENGSSRESFAATAVQKMNTAIANTGLDSSFRFRLVGTMETGSSALGSLQDALYAAKGQSTTVNGTSISWPSVKTKRNEFGADIVCVMIDTGSAYGTVGLGFSMESANRSYFSDSTFNACAIRAVVSGHTMTHEVGHNMGAGHTDMVADTSNRGPQLFSYSSGYYFTAGDTSYHTIMAYNTDGYGNYYTAAPFFSSSSHQYNGTTVGNSTHDNSRTLANTFAEVAAYRSATIQDNPPDAPSWVDASDGDYSSYVLIEWGASSGATSYEVYRSTSYSGTKTRLGETSSATYWYDYNATAGTTYYYWVKASNDAGTSGFSDYDTGWRASATQDITLQNALDNTTLTFTTGGDADWFGQTSTTYDYEDAAQSGSIGDGESSWMETTVSGQGTLAFWWKTSSESGWDTLALYVDGSQAQLISGDSSWTQVSATVKGSGSHTIRWVYLKDDGTSSGSDCGWVDQVVWTPDGGGGEGEGTAKYALCVGLNEYEDVSSLSGCANDAAFFQASLVERGGWAKADTTLLVNNGATKSAIRSAIANYAAKAVAGDTFVYVHSSHGGQNYGTSVYLCAYDDDYEDTELAEDLARFRSGVKIAVIVDACHSGGLFKGGARKGGAAGIARRVTALMDENRAKSLAKGEKAAASKIASSEIGWVTAADYNESSIDWGFYDTDSWLWDPDAEGVDYGGTFIGSFVWSWWNDTADYCDVGDGDGYADPYECWRVAYDFCTGLDSFWGYSGESFTPQYLNESALRKVELGSSGGGRVILPRPTIPEAVDNTTLAFTTGGSANWFGQSTTTHDGADAAQSGYIDNSQSSWMQTTVSGSGTLSFWWKVSSEEDYDYLRLYIDGALVREISGSTSWQQVTLSKTWVGTHTIRWTYSKDYSVSDYSDCGWVDQVTWTPAPRTLTPVYRFYSPRTKGHFFTMNEAEKNNLIATASHIWNFEGIAYYAYQTQLAGTVPLYRFYSPRTRGHFYTKSEAEKNSLIATASHIWNFEGISYFVAASRLAGTTPIYRFWAPGAKHHFYTRNEAEKNNLIARYSNIWNYEGIAFYAWATRAASSDAATVDGGNARTSTLAAAPDWQSAPDADSASSARQRAGVEARGANDPESRDDEGVAATPAAFGLVSLPDETPLPDEGIAESEAVAMEIRAEMPEEGVFASDLDGEWGDGAVSMRLLLPEGLFAIPQLDEETGEVVDGDAEGAVDFELPTSGAWYLLRVKDKAGEEVFSRWMRAAP